MARLESQSKLLYYPTPNTIAATLATWFTSPHRTRIADPCCGTGEALARSSLRFSLGRTTTAEEIEAVFGVRG